MQRALGFSMIVGWILTGCAVSNAVKDSDISETPKQESTANIQPAQSPATITLAKQSIVNWELASKNFQWPSDDAIAAESEAEDTNIAVEDIVDDPQPGDIWDRIRAGYGLPDMEHPRIESELNFYVRNPDYVARVVERGTPYIHHIVEEATKRNIPLEIALLPVVESAFQPFAYSHGRAAGIWQFIPGTGKRYGLKQSWWYDGRRDIVAATDAAFDYLSYLHKYFDGDWLLALAAYNAGEGNVRKAVRINTARHKPVDFFSLKLPRETQSYVPKLLAFAKLIAAPEHYGHKIAYIPDEPYFATVETSGQIDIALAAELAGLSVKEMYQMNPGFNRWATDPDGPHRLAIPLENIDLFKQNLAQLPEAERIRWVRHKIKSGEALLTIAKQYNTTVDMLRQVNSIRGNNIRAGHYLTVPVAKESDSTYALSASQRLAQTQAQARSGHKTTHTVVNGDTLWDISRAYGVSVRALAKWNGMAPGDRLKLDQKLVVWVKDAQLAQRPTNLRTAFPQEMVRSITYTVRSGDSLARIAGKFNVSLVDIKRWNPAAAKAKYLKPGQRIRVRVDITQQAGA